jgi:hypothetical protein
VRLAVCILCHKNPRQINHLLSLLDHEWVSVYIHVDTKSGIEKYLALPRNATIISNRISVQWGSIDQIFATLNLLSHARDRGGDFDYVTLLSGQDLPTRPLEQFQQFLEQNSGRQFMRHFRLPSSNWTFGLERLQYYWPSQIWDQTAKGYTKIGRAFVDYVQSHFLRDLRHLPPLYGGSTWFTITRQMMTYCLDYVEENPGYLHSFLSSAMADEIFFQTIVLNHASQDIVVNDDLVYVDWSSGPETPRVLRVTDIDKMRESHTFFARKFDLDVDATIVDSVTNIVRGQ